jgi:hypothetical protein
MAGAAGGLNLFINQNATFRTHLVWTTGGDTPQPIPNINCEALLQIRTNEDSPSILYEASTAKGNIILEGSNGGIDIVIPASDTSGFVWATGFYDLLIKDNNGTVTRLIEGTVTVKRGVSVFEG